MKPYILVLIAACLPVVAQTPGAIPGSSTVIPFVSLVQSAGSDCIFALHTDTITGMSCANTVTDGTVETAFTNGVLIPANTLSNNSITVNSAFLMHGTATVPTVQISLRLGGISGTLIYQSLASAPAAGDQVSSLACTISALGAASSTTPLVVSCAASSLNVIIKNSALSNTAQSIATDVTTTKKLVWTAKYSAATAGNAVGLYSMFNGIR